MYMHNICFLHICQTTSTPSSPHPTMPNEVSAPWWLRFEANANRPPLCWTWVRLAAGDYQKFFLMIFGWVFGGLLAKSTLDDAKLITDHFILNRVSLPNLVVICSGWDVSFIGHVRNEGQVMLPHANQLHSWEILNFEWAQHEANNNYFAW